MKTNDFLVKLQTIDFDVPEQIEINYKERFVRVSEEDFSIFINLDEPYYRIQVFDKTVPKDLLDLIIEYVNTPLEEREEEKKYKLRLKGIRIDENYLNHDKNERVFFIGSETDFVIYKTIFTQSEIDNFPKEIKKHNWEYIEVE